MQLEQLIIVLFVLMLLYQLGKFITAWIRDLPVPPDPWDAVLSFLRKDAPVSYIRPPSDKGMKKLLTAQNWSGIDVSLLRGLLEQEGIACMIKNEALVIAIGDLPPTECYPQLWLLDATDYPRAKEIFEAWRTTTPFPASEDAG